MLLDPDRPGLVVCECVSLSAQCRSSINPPPVHKMLLRVHFDMGTAQERQLLVACMFTNERKRPVFVRLMLLLGVESMINKSIAVV